MKKAAALTAICLLLAAAVWHGCRKEPKPDSTLFTVHFKYGRPIYILEDSSAQNTRYMDAAKYYCYLEEERRMFIFTALDIDTAYLEPLIMTEQVLRWRINAYRGPHEHYQGDAVIQAWFSDTVTCANFDFIFRLRLHQP